MITLMQAVVGSRAYGLETPQSDTDTFGVYVYDREAYLGLDWPTDSVVTTAPHPDSTRHEVGKYLSLALKGNPSIIETMFLDNYTFKHSGYNWILEYRDKFIGYQPTMSAYTGYINAQIHKFTRREDYQPKKMKHVFRLLEQGTQLLTTGQLSVKVSNPEFYHDLNNWEPEALVLEATNRLEQMRSIVMSPLPTVGDRELANTIVTHIRMTKGK